MIPGELHEDLIALAEGMFAGLTQDEAMVARLYAEGNPFDGICDLMENTPSSAKATLYRAAKKLGVSHRRIPYLVGIHDARAHSRALREDIVHVMVTRTSTGTITTLEA